MMGCLIRCIAPAAARHEFQHILARPYFHHSARCRGSVPAVPSYCCIANLSVLTQENHFLYLMMTYAMGYCFRILVLKMGLAIHINRCHEVCHH